MDDLSLDEVIRKRKISAKHHPATAAQPGKPLVAKPAGFRVRLHPGNGGATSQGQIAKRRPVSAGGLRSHQQPDARQWIAQRKRLAICDARQLLLRHPEKNDSPINISASPPVAFVLPTKVIVNDHYQPPPPPRPILRQAVPPAADISLEYDGNSGGTRGYGGGGGVYQRLLAQAQPPLRRHQQQQLPPRQPSLLQGRMLPAGGQRRPLPPPPQYSRLPRNYTDIYEDAAPAYYVEEFEEIAGAEVPGVYPSFPHQRPGGHRQQYEFGGPGGPRHPGLAQQPQRRPAPPQHPRYEEIIDVDDDFPSGGRAPLPAALAGVHSGGGDYRYRGGHYADADGDVEMFDARRRERSRSPVRLLTGAAAPSSTSTVTSPAAVYASAAARSARHRAPAPTAQQQQKQPPPPEPPVIEAYKVSISGLHANVTREDIYELFSSVGTVRKCSMLGSGSAEVVYPTRSEGEAAVRRYNRRELDGMPMMLRLTAVGLRQSGSAASGGAGRRAGI